MPTKRLTSSVHRALAGICATALALAAGVALPRPAQAEPDEYFHHLSSAALTGATASLDSATDSAFSSDGRTLVSTDTSALVLTDLSDPGRPRRIARLPVDRPIAVAVAGTRALVATSGGLSVFDIARHRRLGSIPLQHTPTDVAASRDGRRAAVALQNGRLVLLNDLTGGPAHWRQQRSPIELDLRSGLIHRADPRPDQIAYSPDGRMIAITLPHNNGVSIVRSSDGGRIRAISAGTANVTGIDTHDDGAIRLVDNAWTQQRRPTGVAWIDNSHLASSSPGTRSWSVYDTGSGKLTWDSGTGLEYRAVENGLYSDANSAEGGSSPDTVSVGTFGGTPYAFIGARNGNFTASYRLADPSKPSYRQLLPTPAHSPIAVSSKAVVADGTDVFGLRRGAPDFPALQSVWSHGKPLGWDGTTGLAADQFHADRIFALTGGHPTQILEINTSVRPAKIDSTVPLSKQGDPYGVRAVGLYQRSDGRFLIAATGNHAADNRVLQADRDGNITGSIKLPADVTRGMTDTGGLGGISGDTVNGTQYIWVAFKRPLQRDPDGVFRIGRYDTDNKSWTWFGYRPESDPGAVELGNVAVVDQRRLALVEQDRSVHGRTATQKITTVSIPTKGAAEHDDLTSTLTAQPATDLISRFSRAGDPLPTKITGLATARNDHAFLLSDSARNTSAGSQPDLVDLGTRAQAFPHHTGALGTTLASWLLPLIGMIMIGIGCLVAGGIAVRARLRRRPDALTL